MLSRPSIGSPTPPEELRAEPSRNFPFLFRIFSGRAQKKNCKGNFCEVADGAIAEAGGAESVRFRFASPRAPRVAHCQRFWK